jgi:hypothetical protein
MGFATTSGELFSGVPLCRTMPAMETLGLVEYRFQWRGFSGAVMIV